MSSMSFQEKSAWGTLTALLGVGGLYTSSLVNLWRADQLHIPSTFGLMVGFTILLVLVLVGYHILVAAITGAQDEDERDRLIGWRAGSIGGFVLAFGVITIVGHIVVGGLLQGGIWQSPAVIANLLLLAVFIATVVELAVTIWFHRRGI
ncbi:MAG: hypothetical protein GVY32_11460 [Gammaproteobacteria bacterium]|nr:hypothetical protein [Gammaproteobacteria bacterium]